MKQLIKNAAYWLTAKWVRETSLPVWEIHKRREELTFFSLSTNPIAFFEHEGALWYFRECPRILPKADYWKTAISRFFSSLDRLGVHQQHFAQEIPVRIDFTETEIQLFREYIEGKYRNPAFQKMLTQADCIAASIRFSIWEKQSYDSAFFAHFALGDVPELCYDIAVYFLWNMRSFAGNYRSMKIVRGKKHSFFAAVKAVASRIVAEELQLAHMITPVRWCRLVVDDGNTCLGILSASAPGQRMMDSSVLPSGSLQREQLCLNVLDAICCQPDHGPNNYNVAANPDGTVAVCAFDNDNPKTFFPGCSVGGSLAGCSGLVNGNNQIQRPYMDRDLALRLQKLDKRKLCRRLSPYLNGLQIAAVCCRLRKINLAIKNTEEKKPDFLKDPDSWDTRTVEEELSGKYGKTYLGRSAK